MREIQEVSKRFGEMDVKFDKEFLEGRTLGKGQKEVEKVRRDRCMAAALRPKRVLATMALVSGVGAPTLAALEIPPENMSD